MAGHIIDCCSLLNLYTGWRGINELKEFDVRWYVPQAVMKESQYFRDYDLAGNVVTYPLDISGAISDGLLEIANIENQDELTDYVNFAIEVDDGEAQALAIARSRGLIFLTDDAKALKLCSRQNAPILTASTATILQSWSEASKENALRAPEIIARIQSLARFSPKPSDDGYAWWSAHRGR